MTEAKQADTVESIEAAWARLSPVFVMKNGMVRPVSQQAVTDMTPEQWAAIQYLWGHVGLGYWSLPVRDEPANVANLGWLDQPVSLDDIYGKPKHPTETWLGKLRWVWQATRAYHAGGCGWFTAWDMAREAHPEMLEIWGEEEHRPSGADYAKDDMATWND